jgi:hypothetical protein
MPDPGGVERSASSRAGAAIFTPGFSAVSWTSAQPSLRGRQRGSRPGRLLQGIAVGLLGPASFRGGWVTSALGLAIHFFIAFTAAAVFYAASRQFPALLDHPWLAGIGYALVVYGFMYPVVIPLDHLRSKRVTLSTTIIAIVTHIVCVGLPISLAVHRFVRRRAVVSAPAL